MKTVIDAGTVLDYALFQLTPTRTRCDLVIFAGKKSEKIASGLLDPYLSHLKSAKEQISRGGYSITLQPSSSDSSSWFTKATLSRFVRFVNTPEILERFVSIDKEIGQIEKEIDSNGLANGTVEPHGGDGDDVIEAEEKPKVRLQRVLKSRKAILEKELAMAYARALVAGFEMDYLQDLASFCDAFGAQRLREACVNFMEICNRKNDDKIWMDEVAAVQASYIGSAGIMASFENNDLTQSFIAKSSTPDSITTQGSLDAGEGTESASTAEFPQHTGVPKWRGNFPPYMQNAQGPYPMFPQMPPYAAGYMFPGFQVPPSHYPPNMAWPGSFHNSGTNLDGDAKKKNRNGDHTGSDSSDEEDDKQRLSTPEEQIHKKKSGKRSSGKVVIRNINFISGGRNDVKGSDSDGYSSGGDEYVDADSIKQHVEAAVGSIKRNHKSKSKKDSQKLKHDSENEDVEPPHLEEDKTNANWDVFQNFLMKDSESRSEATGSRTVHAQENFGEEILTKKLERKYASEDFLFTERSSGSRAEGNDIRFDGGEVLRRVVNRSTGEEVLIPNRAEGDRSFQNSLLGTESTLIRPQKEEDWITGSKSDWMASQTRGVDQSIYQASGNFQTRDREKDVLDDSFMIQTRSSEEAKMSGSKADIFMEPDIVGSFASESSVPQVLQEKVETCKFSEPEDLYMISRNDSVTEQVAASWTPEMDYVNSAQKVKADAVVSAEKSAKKVAAKDTKDLKSRSPSGYLGRSKSAAPTRSKISSPGIATSRSRLNPEEERRKRMEELLIQRQKRIAERSAANGGTASESMKTAPKGVTNKSSASSQIGKAKLQAPVNENKTLNRNLTRSFTMDRLSTPRIINKQPSAESRVSSNATRATPLKKTKGTVGPQDKVNPSDKKTKNMDASKNASSKAQEAVQPKQNGVNDFGTIKDLHTVTSVEKKETSPVPTADIKDSSQVLSDVIISSQDASVVEMRLPDITTDLPCLPTPITENTSASGATLNPDIKKLPFSPEISVVDNISTPPSYTETNAELSPLAPPRKKWGDGGTSPKAPKGFRKLLLFGRKS